jgi:2-polyprenyl-3-methyl-5-hydroxy-6-metoxy-1,4-benzoquinol methylase
MITKSHNTAISRGGPSAPLLALERMGLINGSVLDYGCGKGADEKYLLSKNISIDSYDPHWNPVSLEDKGYDTILCTYVLNVLDNDDGMSVISSIKEHLNPNGKAYLSVRRDVKTDGPTSRGFQRNVFLDYPVVKERKNNYCIYELSA